MDSNTLMLLTLVSAVVIGVIIWALYKLLDGQSKLASEIDQVQAEQAEQPTKTEVVPVAYGAVPYGVPYGIRGYGPYYGGYGGWGWGGRRHHSHSH